MDFDLKLYGYRCFPPSHPPTTIQFRNDIVALVGINNSGKSALLKSIFELMGLKCKVLQRRATENYFSEQAIQYLYPQLRALGPFEPLKALQNHWPKKKNWRIAKATKKEEIEGTDLWKILTEIAKP